LRAEGSLSKEKSKERRCGHVPVLSQTFVIGKSLELAVESQNGRATSGQDHSRSRSGAGSVQSIRSLEPSPRSSTKLVVHSRLPVNPDVLSGQECTLYSLEKSYGDAQNSSIIKIGTSRRSPCHSSPNFKEGYDDFV